MKALRPRSSCGVRRSVRGHTDADAALVWLPRRIPRALSHVSARSPARTVPRYHDADEALRRTVLAVMNEPVDDAPSPFVLQGPDFSATGKLTNVANVPLCPGATPFIRLVNSGEEADPNVDVIARAFASAPSQDIVIKGRVRGRILDVPLSLTDAATLLDELRYEHYRPTADGWEGTRWRDLEAKVGIDSATDIDGLLPFFRPPAVAAEEATPYSRGGPYAISAYLRLWKACLTRHARGLVATDDPRVPWSMLDLVQKSREQPVLLRGNPLRIRVGDRGRTVRQPRVHHSGDDAVRRRG